MNDAITSIVREATVWEGFYVMSHNSATSENGYPEWTNDDGATLQYSEALGSRWAFSHDHWGTCYATEGNVRIRPPDEVYWNWVASSNDWNNYLVTSFQFIYYSTLQPTQLPTMVPTDMPTGNKN